ncbi:MAG: bifunctional 5,10-methylenetetrahydrofolate dehydrogenase/5,10-methenyltetrahydrofolate cyclohydrolase [bacterium]
MKLLHGKLVANEILAQLQSELIDFEKKPRLDVILIGNDQASHLYVALKRKKAKEIGIEFLLHEFTEEVQQGEIVDLIVSLNENNDVSGIIVQLPILEKFDTDLIISTINPKKDVDGFHGKNIELFLSDSDCAAPVFPLAILQIIKSVKKMLVGKNTIVVANSDEFGKIMCAALGKDGFFANYFLSSSFDQNIAKIKNADIVISAVGIPGIIAGKMLKSGAVVVDGGIKNVDGKILGDVDFASTAENVGYITPVPGGVGPVTIACLLQNVYLAFKAQQREK